MDFKRLKRKGWTDSEIEHARMIFEKAKHQKVSDIVALWLLFLCGLAGVAGLLFLIYPLTILFDTTLSVVMIFIAGLILGLLLAFALKSLRAKPEHHVSAMSMFIILALALSTILLGLLSGKLGGGGVLLYSIVFVIAMTVPYILERRLHESP
jgi:peptidoglycan/LPS O-acetylase OafA/YrhL